MQMKRFGGKLCLVKSLLFLVAAVCTVQILHIGSAHAAEDFRLVAGRYHQALTLTFFHHHSEQMIQKIPDLSLEEKLSIFPSR